MAQAYPGIRSEEFGISKPLLLYKIFREVPIDDVSKVADKSNKKGLSSQG
jgi:hypothetical protein